jgi:ribosome-associated toxin RatA of RatAB toxin-antitoxin module
MGQASTSEIFNAPVETVFKVLSDYNNYPKVLSDVKRASILESGPDKKLVEFEINVIKTFRYQLWLFEKPSEELSWRFHSGELFKENTGSWKLKSLGDGRTHVDYTITAKFGVFVPGMIEKKLIEVNLPTMMKSFRSAIEGL